MNPAKVPYLYATLWLVLLSVYGGVRFAQADTQPCIDAINNQFSGQASTTLAIFEETSPDHFEVEHVLFKGESGRLEEHKDMTCVISNGKADLV